MITTKLVGCMCNNLYCIYTIYYFCKRNNISFDNIILEKHIRSWKDSSICKHRKSYFLNNTYKICDNIKNKFTDEIDFSRFKSIKYTKYLVHCDNFYFNDFNWEYNIDEELMKYLFINSSYYDICSDYLEYKNSCLAVHVRRKDFLLNSKFTRFVLNKDEYNKRIKDNYKKYNKVIVFSDDIDWCKENILDELRSNVIFHERLDSDYKDLYIMSLCDNVICNKKSTFSLFGYSLSKTRKKFNII